MNLFLLFAIFAAITAAALGFAFRHAKKTNASTHAILAIAVFTPIAAIAIYLAVGSPHLPDQPLAERIKGKPQNLPPNALAARIENQLAKKPRDQKGWEILGLIRLQQEQYAQAEYAFRRAAAIKETAPILSALAEAITERADGTITQEARNLLERAQEKNPKNLRALWFLALAAHQEQRHDKAQKLWQKLLNQFPKDSPQRRELSQTIRQIKMRGENKK